MTHLGQVTLPSSALAAQSEASGRLVLNDGQQRALSEILAAYAPGECHLLTGYAGTGKTTLMEFLAGKLRRLGLSCVMTAPTHKAVAVLVRKLRHAGIEGVPCVTIHSLLSLTPKPWGDRLVFERQKHAKPVMQDVVVIDECSMISTELLGHIQRHLPNSFVLFVGDSAQLPPVGEVASQTFDTPSRSHLDTIVRQAEGNPILEAAHIIRRSQGGAMDWSWCEPVMRKPLGVYVPGSRADEWMRKAFTSPEFAADPDSFRYLAYRNERVHWVNEKVRRWIYGDRLPTPFMPGERALLRAPVVRDGTIVLATNEEATVVSITRGELCHAFRARGGPGAWTASVPSWRITLRGDDGAEHIVHTTRDAAAYDLALARIVDEARVTAQPG